MLHFLSQTTRLVIAGISLFRSYAVEKYCYFLRLLSDQDYGISQFHSQ